MSAIILVMLVFQGAPAEPDGDVALARAEALLAEGRPREALELARSARLAAVVFQVGAEDRGRDRQHLSLARRQEVRGEAVVGRALRDLGRHEEAAAALTRALRGMEALDPAGGAGDAGRIELALDLAATLVRCPELGGLEQERARDLLDRIDGWIEALPEADRSAPAIRAALARGDLALASGDRNVAREAWRRGRELARRSDRAGDEIQATLRLAENALAAGEADEARSLFASAATMAPVGQSPSWAVALLGSVRANEFGLGLEERLERLEAAAGVLDRFGEPQAGAAAYLEAASFCLVGGLFARVDSLLDSAHRLIGSSDPACWLLGWERYAGAERLRLEGNPEGVEALLEGGGPEGRIALAFMPQLSLARARALRDLGREAEMILAYERAWELLVRWRCAGEITGLPRGLHLEPRAVALEIADAMLGARERTEMGRPVDLAYRVLEGTRAAPAGEADPLASAGARAGGAEVAGGGAGTATGRVVISPATLRSREDLQATIAAWGDARRRWLMRFFDAEEVGLPDAEIRDLERMWAARRQAEALDPLSVSRLTGEAPSLAHLRDVIEDVKTAYVAYALAPAASYALAVIRDRQVLVRLPGLAELARPIAAFAERCEGAESAVAGGGAPAASLEMRLIEPLLARLPSLVDRLLISVAGPTRTIPFEALMRGAPGQAPRYLGESFEVSLVASARDLVEARRTESLHQGGGGTAVVVGPAAASAGEPQGSLTGLLEGILTREACQTLLGADATHDRLALALEQPCSIVQIEAISGTDEPDGGWHLAGEDREMTRARIAALGLDVDLALLVGPPLEDARRAELADAFLANGARTVLVSRWRPGRQMERLFLQGFYRGVARGLTVSQALRLARGEMIRQGGEAARPRSWAWLEHRGAPLSWVRLEQGREWLAPMVFLLLAGLFVATIVMFVMLRRLRVASRESGLSGRGRMIS